MKQSNIVNYPNYYVTSDGRVFNITTGRCLKPANHKYGYPLVSLSKDGKVTKKYVHRLVAEAYIPNPNNLCVVMHLDDNPSNSNVTNLRWATQHDNMKDRNEKKRQAKGEKNGRSKLSDEQRIEIHYKYTNENHSLRSLAVIYGVHHSQISNIVKSLN